MAIFDLPYPYVTDAGQCDANFHFLSSGVFVPFDSQTTLTGDVTGHGILTIPTTVSGIGGHPVASTNPSSGQVLQWTGTQWSPATLPAPGLGTVTNISIGVGLVGNPNPLTSSGSIALQVPVSIANGGTGATNAAQALVNLGAVSSNNPTFTGIPVAPTPPLNDNSNAIATTAWVREQNYLTGNQTITLSGDASGAGTQAITVTTTGLQGRHVSNVAPGTNQVLQWDGSQWTPGSGIAGSYLPLTGGTLSGQLNIIANLYVAGAYIYQAGSGATGNVNTVGGPLIFADTNNTVFKLGSGNQNVLFQNYYGTNIFQVSSSGSLTVNSLSVSGTVSAGLVTAPQINATAFNGSGQSYINILESDLVRPYSGNGSGQVGYYGMSYSAMSAYAYGNPSDARDKTDIKSLPNCLEIVNAIDPKRFRWRGDLGDVDKRTQWGFVAQEVDEAMRQAGHEFGGHFDDGEHQGLVYDQLISILWKAVQELSEKE
jgi:hypothetical protein